MIDRKDMFKLTKVEGKTMEPKNILHKKKGILKNIKLPENREIFKLPALGSRQISGKMKYKEIKVISRQIAGMLKSGCDILSVFETLIESSTVKTSYMLSIASKGIRSGKNLTESFALTNGFPKFFINMIYAGENSGNIDYVFEKLSEYYEREDRIKTKLISASIYPIILLIVSFIAANIIFVVVVPDFKTAFDMDDSILPLSTRIIFSASDFLRKNALYLYIGTAVTMYFAVKTARQSMIFRFWLDEKKFKIPRIKKINELVISEKISRTLALLMGSGVHITEAMNIAIDTVDNTYAERKLKITCQNIEKGNSISRSIQAAGIFPKSFVSMLKSGEESGNFDSSLIAVSMYYREELDKEIDRIIKLIEPVMILIMGFVIGIAMVSLIYPMVSVISTIS